MVINTNIQAQTGARLLGESSSRLSQSLARLSSGSKIVSPADDAAGLAVSTRFDAQINRTGAAINNLGNTLSFCQTQDGYMNKIGKALDRMSELAMLAQDVTKTDSDRSLYNREFQTLNSYVSSIATKDFNGVTLFSSSALNVTIDTEGVTLQMAGVSGTYLAPSVAQPYAASTTLGTLQPGMPDMLAWIGDGGVDHGNDITASSTIQDMVDVINGVSEGHATASYNTTTGDLSVTVDAGYKLFFTNPDSPYSTSYPSVIGLSALDNIGGSSSQTTSVTLTQAGSSGAGDISTASGAVSALTTVKSAINQLATDRATVGATIARLNSTSESLSTLKENLAAANSRIKDVDVAEESTAFARYNILVQSGTAMLAQANATPNSVLKLLS